MPPDTKQLILGSKTPKPNVTPDRKKVALREVNYRLDENTGPIREPGSPSNQQHLYRSHPQSLHFAESHTQARPTIGFLHFVFL
jgi:hypothetical protein